MTDNDFTTGGERGGRVSPWDTPPTKHRSPHPSSEFYSVAGYSAAAIVFAELSGVLNLPLAILDFAVFGIAALFWCLTIYSAGLMLERAEHQERLNATIAKENAKLSEENQAMRLDTVRTLVSLEKSKLIPLQTDGEIKYPISIEHPAFKNRGKQ